jgi:hypothetical protein
MKEHIDVDGLDALLVAARRLQEIDLARFQSVLALCRAYVSVYDRPDELDEIFMSRVGQISPRNPKASA